MFLWSLAMLLLIPTASPPSGETDADHSNCRGETQGRFGYLRHIGVRTANTLKLNAVELSTLRVEWGEPSLQEDKFYRALSVPMRMFVKLEEVRKQQPADWTLPVSIVLARYPDGHPDWSRGYREEDSVWCDTFVELGKDTNDRSLPPGREVRGSFLATFYLPRFRRPVGTAKPFQIGISVAGVEYFSTELPVLPQTIGTITVSGPPRLRETLQLINGTPSPGGEYHDPVALIRAVNHLRSLEKPQAIVGLREFLTFANHWSVADWEPRDPENSDTSDEDCLELLIPLVFERIDPNEKLPAGGPGLPGWLFMQKLKNGEPLPTRLPKPEKSYALIEEEWSIREITIWNGIPFQTFRYVRGGIEPILEGPRIPATTYLVDWAEDRGKLIEGRLRPTDDPLAATDELFNELAPKLNLDKKSEWERDTLRSHLRIQAWRMVAHLVEPERKKPRDRFDELFDSEERWTQLKQKTEQLGIRWEEERQEYVAGKSR